MAMPADRAALRAPTPTPRLPRAERREQIARTAAKVFVRGGFDGASMDDVAREAGVTRLIVYRIFESKEDLYRAVLELVIDDVATTFPGPLAGPLAAPGTDPGRDDSIAGLLLGVARRHPDGFRLLWRHAAHEPPFREVAALFKMAVTDYAIALFEPSMHDATIRRWAAESVVSHLYESVCLWLDDGDPLRDDEFLDLITAGIRSMVTRWIELVRPAPS